MAASLKRRLRSIASRSRRALVLELPLGATPVIRRPPSLGVKLTNPISPTLPPLESRDRRCLRMAVGVPGTIPRPEALRADATDPLELWRECAVVGVGGTDGCRVLRIGEHDKCRAPEDGARGGRCRSVVGGIGGGGGR
jgi:hypothetical protein